MLGERILAEPPLVGRRQVGLAHDALTGRRLDQELRVVEMDARDLVGDAGECETEQLAIAPAARSSMAATMPASTLRKTPLNVAMVLDEAELGVE